MKTMIRIDESFNKKGSIKISVSLIYASNLYRYLITVVIVNNSALVSEKIPIQSFKCCGLVGSTDNEKSAAVIYEILAPLSGKP